MSKLLFVVHRYAPYPGGSEYYVQNMAEEALSRGHTVTVLAHEHMGDLNGVKVTNDYNVLVTGKFDLIIVHGGDVVSQNVVHTAVGLTEYTGSKILYMIIKPSESPVCLLGMKNATHLGFSTNEDLKHIYKYGQEQKMVYIPHGIPIEKSIREKTKTSPFCHFVSAGGFWPHKGMVELAETFIKCEFKQPAWLHLYGYGPGPEIPYHPCITVVRDAFQDQVLEAIANADAYILNSTEEGFGLVLLEAMANKTPWIARDIAGASVMRNYGYTYTNQDQLKAYMQTLSNCKKLKEFGEFDINKAFDYVCNEHSIKNTVDAIEGLLK